ncbi:MAG: BREX-1 system adenine-specific DNA-methyltransferase PglX [Acidobacteriia bacterium]|nr:BREX-1 system adenine-specific DNA-methyltransferase PglX [Terriglobia bacterium]
MIKVLPSLEVHWGGAEGARDLVVGYLEFDGREWSFQYADGLGDAARLGFEGFQGLPKQAADAAPTKSPNLFPAFSGRIPNLRRADVVRACGDLTTLPREEALYEFLRRSGARTGTDQIWFTEVTRKAGRESEGLGKALRNEIRKMVGAIRDLLNEDIRIQLEGTFRILRDGQILDADAVDQEKRHDREAIESAIRYEIAAGRRPQEAVEHFTREVGFTSLNRLAALKMMEARGLIQESVSRGQESSGFRLFRRVCEEVCSSQPDGGYRRYLELLFDDAAVELRVLFDRALPHSRIFPRPDALNRALKLLNESCPAEVWKSDETIGWIYQYFTPKEDREALRDPQQGGAQAPRNSYELAVRNQFYTPRYVVEFLTDNTLGRAWYEMRKGRTKLVDVCQYLVRRPNEAFLTPEETPQAPPAESEPSQDELLRQLLVVPYRAMKDPRDIRILDPACGSGHFLLYAFDLLFVIYEEAWADPSVPAFTETGQSLHDDYRDVGLLRRELPSLILRHNIHGIDIDLRATQIAALALWLRAQRAYQELGLKAFDRPLIRRSNIVCAEPMPGDRALLDEFLAGLQLPVLRQLVRVVFDKMALAGEAGSLLRVEEEIAVAVAEAKRQWGAGTKAEQMLLWPEARRPKAEQGILFDTTGITEETFWHDAEERLLEELSRYARHAENGRGVARRLFAEDAAQGFAFVDVCRKRFDVVVMNPPFGLATSAVFSSLRERSPETYVEIYASFVRRALEISKHGFVGAITSRGFLTMSRLAEWRVRDVIPRLRLLLDLGLGVMDEAYVESCAYVLDRNDPDGPLDAFDARAVGPENVPNPSNILGSNRASGVRRYALKRSSLLELPEAKILYSVGDRLAHLLAHQARFEPAAGIVRTGLTTFDDFRFLRVTWEVGADRIGPGRHWEPFSKGGEYAKYYTPLHLLVNRRNNGAELAEVNVRLNGQTAQSRQGSKYYYKAGLTFTSRSAKGFTVRALPAGCVISHNAPTIYPNADISKEYLLGWINSSLIRALVEVQKNFSYFVPGTIKDLPWIEPTSEVRRLVEALVSELVNRYRQVWVWDETDPFFIAPPKVNRDAVDLPSASVNQEHGDVIRDHQRGISGAIDGLYQVDSSSFAMEVVGRNPDEEVAVEELDESSAAAVVASYAIGCCFGRWDIRIGRDPSLVASSFDAFVSTPICSPGMLVGSDGQPAKAGCIVSEEWLRAKPSLNGLPPEGAAERPTIQDDEYPLQSLPWDGILVDDEGHARDVVARVREVLRVVWKDRADEIEDAVCKTLGVKDLRSYFRNPRNFFEDHIKRYSKSRRRAPVYWLLQSPRKSYGVWLYYHRLTRDTLFHLLRNYIEPKIEHEEGRRHELRRLYEAAKHAKAGADERRLAKEVDAQETLVGELADFRAKIEAVAYGRLPDAEQGCPGWDPDLNDGVILSIAPLHAVVPWKEAAKAWEELAAGRYEWSHVALRFWPKRVEAKCREDRSIAIAHGEVH